MKVFSSPLKVGGQVIELETGQLAQQANAAVIAKSGDNVVLATVVMSAEREDINYFPLYVEYQEKLYSGGKIKGSRWVKREGRPSDDSILTARLIDRSIRPLFPKGFKNEVQVVVTTLSVDGQTPLTLYPSMPYLQPLAFPIFLGRGQLVQSELVSPIQANLLSTPLMNSFKPPKWI